ncbi:UDP-N-acetylglucosamine--peptide N-acetylglucosaminyltransferase 110 kDa subunit [Rhynchospora pubera]|uniref:UDP-N-acetylglucosamine--peptide N-acetylglucosaminyltransferase 110 kDa subunit n=1 Tax=Rhynchospora pubera TaxID=906938 RepID=A0AAV8AJK1_9POAL|nr:UDP-N-acetylglucosamine--peptide N-acetylglucosaminyltransferase 110 kDa subunit [Rhynchospora pubera]KAJ4777562.1 UDP-N-acetylglucosamine--peptide N-acetylglucosaminyltransferase 110 kDa subunit [Rhynchospora pubera]
MPEMQLPGGSDLLPSGGGDPSPATTVPPRPSSPRRKPVIIADLNLNDDPPESDGEDGMLPPTPADPSTRSNVEESASVKSTASAKDPDLVENEDLDQQCQGASMSREEKVCSLKAGLVNVARKVPKNAHAHYILGLMYQRLGQPQKAILAYEKSAEILLQDEDDVRRPDLLAMVRIHHSQCILQATTGDSLDKELDARELGEILTKLDTSMQADVKQASVWNTLGAILLKMGQLKNAISVFSSILAFSPDHLDSMANLGVAFLQSGKLDLALRCFQDLVLRDQNHPAALLNYATCLLYKHGSITAGPGSLSGEESNSNQVEGINVAKECLLAAARSEPKVAQLWVNLANAYYLAGEHTNAKSCLEQAAKLEPNQMAVRYAIATHRIREAERAQELTDQLVWAANEMATLIKEGDPAMIDIPTAWSGFAMAHKTQHEIGATYESKQMDIDDVEERALCTLKQTINEDSDDSIHWHQLGLHNLRTMQFKPSVKFFKSALVRSLDCSYTWSNLGTAFHLSHDRRAETVYKRALSLSRNIQAHAILANLGNLYREQRRLELAKKILSRSLELCPGYAPANNNLGLVFAAQGQWEEAIGCFKKAIECDPLLDCAQSNIAKAMTLSTSHGTTGN